MKPFLPPMDQTEEKRCLEELSNGSVEAKNKLIERNMRLVAHVARKYQGADEDMEELISIGTIGLIKAVMTFDSNRENRLGTYAARCIDNELLMYFRSKKKRSREVSLYESIGMDKEGNQIQFMDIMEVDDPDIAERLELDHNVKKLYRIFPKVLSKREQQILMMRYGIYNSDVVTQREIAKKLGISRSYVSRIEKRAILKLRKNFQNSY